MASLPGSARSSASAGNPTAHEPKILGTLTARDAIDLLTQMSYLHRRLDECTETGHLRQLQND